MKLLPVLEYRTNRDKILQTRKRLAEKRERNKTRGMMIGVAQKQAAQTNGFDIQLRKAADNLSDQQVRELAGWARTFNIRIFSGITQCPKC